MTTRFFPPFSKVGVLTPPPSPSDNDEKRLCNHMSHPGGGVKYGSMRQIIRMITMTGYFAICVWAIFCTQLIGAPLYFISKPLYYAWMARTKGSFGLMMTTLTQWWSPTVVRVTGDRSVKHQLKKTEDGRLRCDFPERMVLIANHQLYSDWLYLWWIAYAARVHRFLYIILKESLKYVPLLGQGMQFYGFIFLARKWQQDKPRFMHRLSKLSANGGKDPMWLLIFPEGTNASDNGRMTSAKYAEKMGIQDLKHTLLPRTTGLSFCLEQLESTVEWMYDCTVVYEGVPRGKFGQDYFTLYSTFCEGRPPKSVNMHFRRFRISEIPFRDHAAFEKWMRDRWFEKDQLVEYFMEHGEFPEDDDSVAGADGTTRANDGPITPNPNGPVHRVNVKQKQHSSIKREKSREVDAWKGPIKTEVRLESLSELFDIFKPLTTFCLLVRIVYQLWSITASTKASFL